MKKTGIAAIGVTAIVLMFGEPAGAQPPTHLGKANASCAGLALSEHAIDDGPGAISGLIAEVKGLATDFGFDNSGQVVSGFARVHAGTHVPGCEEAFFTVLTTGP
ncbi:MAG: hypothetical protein ACT4PX_11580 [Actinomycetota bacterium]